MYTANTLVLVHFSETFWPMFLSIILVLFSFSVIRANFQQKFGQRFQPWPRSVANGKDVKYNQS